MLGRTGESEGPASRKLVPTRAVREFPRVLVARRGGTSPQEAPEVEEEMDPQDHLSGEEVRKETAGLVEAEPLMAMGADRMEMEVRMETEVRTETADQTEMVDQTEMAGRMVTEARLGMDLPTTPGEPRPTTLGKEGTVAVAEGAAAEEAAAATATDNSSKGPTAIRMATSMPRCSRR